ncbi:MAG TPA: hypothetical protein VN837_00340 [Chloroflexota bacterium]|nr:hypothetical protein [Chloroflexota bacterium]
MSLTPAKVQRILANRAIMRIGRAAPVAAVYRTAYGGEAARAVSLILKQQGTNDPATEDTVSRQVSEYLAEIPLEVDPRPIAYLALTPVTDGIPALDAASIAAAIQLEIVAYRLSGLVPSRWQVTLRRLR